MAVKFRSLASELQGAYLYVHNYPLENCCIMHRKNIKCVIALKSVPLPLKSQD